MSPHFVMSPRYTPEHGVQHKKQNIDLNPRKQFGAFKAAAHL